MYINMISAGCMVKEWDGKPKILYYDDSKDGYISVKPCEGYYATPIYLPREIVFKFDADLFKELGRLFEMGNMDDLNRAWGRAVPWNDDSK